MIALKWSSGCIRVDARSDSLKLRSLNIDVEIRPRTVIVEGGSGYSIGSDNRRKYIYTYFKGRIQPIRECGKVLEVHGSRMLDLYEFRYTRTYYDEYYTVVLPGSFFIEYIILTSDELCIALSRKREAYFEEIGDILTIYIA